MSESNNSPTELSDMPETPCGKAGIFKKTDVSGWKTFKPVFDEDKCVGCLQCWLFCPHGAIERTSGESSIVINLDDCKGCGICANICPTEAIEMVKIRGDRYG